jgi:hypothetical protein
MTSWKYSWWYPIVALIGVILWSSNVVAQNQPTQDKKEPDGTPLFAFVALKEHAVPSESVIVKSLRNALPPGSKIKVMDNDGGKFTFQVDDCVAMFGHIPRPIPWTDLRGPCAESYVWPDAAREMKGHRTHLIAMLFGGKESKLATGVMLTKLLAAASEAYDCAGIYWGHGSVVLSPELIQKAAAEASVDKPPLLTWISFHRQISPDGKVSVFTEGLEYFDCHEIEVIESSRPPMDVFNMVSGIAYICLKGEVIKDGDTVGHDNGGKIKTKYTNSVREGFDTVLRVDF